MGALAKLAWLVWMWSPAPLVGLSDRNVIFHVNQIRVIKDTDQFGGPLNGTLPAIHYLLRGDTHRGWIYLKPDERRLHGDPSTDLSRLAATYHHREGPAGVIMERFNWFPGPQNTYWADARMPASIAGLGGDPLSQLVNVWSEPPFAVVGMYVGEMASYARPFQYLDFFEIDPEITKLSLPPKGRARYFSYIQDALDRGAFVRVFHGEERPTLQKQGPHCFYHVMLVEVATRDRLEAISVNLLTKEGVAACFDRLAPQGVLCLHTSHRYLNLVPVLADVAESLGLACRVGKDGGQRYDADERHRRVRGLFASEYVVLARDEKYLPPETDDPVAVMRRGGLSWSTPVPFGKHVWRDKSWNSLRGVIHHEPALGALRLRVREVENGVYQFLERFGIAPGWRWRMRAGTVLWENPVWEGLNWLGITLRQLINQRAEALSN
jgi:hypothetical protein